MNIGEIMQYKGVNLKRDLRSLYLTRLERIQREGSPYETWQVPVTAAGVTSSIDIFTQFPRSRKYMPLDWLEVVNNGTVNVTLIVNGAGGDFLPVPAGTVRPVIKKSVTWIGVRNDDALNPTVLNLVTVTLRRQPITTDDVIRGSV